MQSTSLLLSKKLAVIVATDAEFDNLKELLSRGLNTWDTAPRWIVELNMQLQSTPAIRNARLDCPLCKQPRTPKLPRS